MAIVDFPQLKALLAREGRLMALDVGSKTIGVATSDMTRMLATPLMTVKRTKLAVDLGVLGELAKKHEARALASGKPIASARASCFFANSPRTPRSTASLVRFTVISGVASMRVMSDVATPIVLDPTSSAIRRPSRTRRAFSWGKSTIAMGRGYRQQRQAR